jgi:hypothetical protein
MEPVKWRWFGACVRGSDHEQACTPCQDAYAVKSPGDGRFVAVVSDGAGSASRSEFGARVLCDVLAEFLLQCLSTEPRLESPVMDEAAFRPRVERGIEAVRTRLTEQANAEGAELRDFHATLVGVMADGTGGTFFHIGDGAAVAIDSSDTSRFLVSQAENGEYANETYFFTQDDWRDHLRFAAIGNEFDMFALMTDGVTPVALGSGGRSPHPPFFDPVSKYLTACPDDVGHEALTELLDRETMRRITGDDKTLVWIKRTLPDA